QLTFYDFSTTWPAKQRGQFQSVTTPGGGVTQVVSRTSDGKPTEVQRSETTGGTTVTESYQYNYVETGVNAGLLASGVLRRQFNGGAWSIVRKVTYEYYDVPLSLGLGNPGDLHTAKILDPAGNVLDTYYYQYYALLVNHTVASGLKYVIG